MLNMSSVAVFSRIFRKIFRTAILKENLPMDLLYCIKEHVWMSASDEATLKQRILVEVNSISKSYTTVVCGCAMVLKIVNY